MESSSYQTLKQKIIPRNHKTLINGVMPTSVHWSSGSPSMIEFNNGNTVPGSCIHCVNPACMEYNESELILSLFSDFPADKNLDTCPSKAISWPHDSAYPIIDSDNCISCGICVSRCPVSAIFLSDELFAVINDEPNQFFVNIEEPMSREILNLLKSKFSGIQKNGHYIQEHDDLIQGWYKKFESVCSNQVAQFPNHLVRNLLITLGNGASMRRRGDNNLRMDIVFEQRNKTGTCEVEIGTGVLDAPRNLLDNVAVLVSRYQHQLDRIIPLIVSLSLPNQRSEYWQVIQDIDKVLNVSINSLTIGILVVMIWNRMKLSFDSSKSFFAESYSLRSQLEANLGRIFNVSIGHFGIVESLK
jgi:ferredoxin